MGPLIVSDITLFIFTIYIGIFLRNFHSSYPEMKVGFHIWEVCYDEKTWEYGNKLAGLYSIIIGIVLFAIIYPILIYLEVKRSYLVGLIILFAFLYLILIYFTVKIKVRKKFNLKDK